LALCSLAFLLGCLIHLSCEIGLSAATAAGLVYGCIALVQTTRLAELQTHLQARRVLAVELLRSTASFLFAAGLGWWWVSEGPTALLLGTALGYGLSVAYSNRRENSPGATEVIEAAALRPTGIVLRQIWNFGWPLSLWLGGQLMMPLIDRTMMATQLGLAETGKFAGMSDILTRCFSLAVFPLVQAVYPRLAQLSDRNDHHQARSLLRRATLLLLLAGAAILPALYWMRHLVVQVALPTPDERMAQLVLPLAVGGFVWQAAMLVHKPLELAKKTRHMLVAMIAAVGIKLAANWLLLPTLGALGAALATLVAGIGYCLLCLQFNRRSSQ
jgi:O-antigen/teichoic acid export membrane protein